MRALINNQPETGGTIPFGVVPITQIQLDANCRDEITKTCRGLQELYSDPQARAAIFEVLLTMQPEDTTMKKGRKGMDLWTIFVLGTLRLACNWDYDKLKSCFDNHSLIRKMTGIDMICDADKITSLQCIHDNVGLYTKEIADKISQISIDFAHRRLFPKTTELHTRTDSFVLLSNVHYPTDFNLLKDCVWKCISLCASTANKFGHRGWREHQSMWTQFRGEYNKLSKMRHSNSKKEEVKEKRTQEINAAIRTYLGGALKYLEKAKKYQEEFKVDIPELSPFLEYGAIFIDQIKRRIFEGEKIPQEEKLYSVFEPYTEWICKGKAGVRQELGVKVCIVEDQHGFILEHRVMKKEQDQEVAFLMAKNSQIKFPNIASMSFDKGFHSKKDQEGKDNRLNIEERLGIVAHLPQMGRRNKEAQKRESSPEFGAARKAHPAVESAINALESHGLDRCPDKGEKNFDRYVAMAVTAANIHHIGAILMARELEKERQRKRKLRKAS